MSARMHRQAPYLKALCRAGFRKRKELIDNAPLDTIKAISECSHNTLRGVVPLSSSQKNRLAKHRRNLRIIADKKISLKKKKLILQKGGALLPLLLGPIIGAVSSLFSR